MTFKLVHIFPNTGELGRLPDGSIINAGGVSGNFFTVGGKPLLFADGTTTDGSSNTTVGTLQSVYDNGSTGQITLASGKDFSLKALNQTAFTFNALTGSVTITGDLTVLGESTVVEGTLQNVDQVAINPTNPTTPALLIEPIAGIGMSTDLVRIRATNSALPVFKIDGTGNTAIKNLTVDQTINGIDLSSFYAAFTAHVSSTGSAKHLATGISVSSTNFANISGDTVQEALDSIDDALSVSTTSIKTHKHVQSVPSAVWTITHNQHSDCPTVTIYDETKSQVLPDEVIISDMNTVTVKFNTGIGGHAVVLLF